MKRLPLAAVIFFATLLLGSPSFSKATEFSIYSGNKSASFYRVASTLCEVFNKYHQSEGYKCFAVESGGAINNLYDLLDKTADIAIIKAPSFDKVLTQNLPIDFDKKIQSIAKIHKEYLTILVNKNSKIKSLSDLKNKVVNIGPIGSSSNPIVEKYFSYFSIKPKTSLNVGASEAFKMICDGKIDAWVYFIGHPNKNYAETLKNCNVDFLSLNKKEIKNFTSLMPSFLRADKISRMLYSSYTKGDVITVSSNTILAARDDLDPKIIAMIQNILKSHKDELIEKDLIFLNF